MAKTTIPARNVTTCDACGVECTRQTCQLGGGVLIRKSGLDLQRNAVGCDNREFDLCDSCLRAVELSIQGAISHIKKGTTHAN
jgi:hypothetical protein